MNVKVSGANIAYSDYHPLMQAAFAAIDITVHPDAFDTYRFSDGAFETDMDDLWAAFRDGKKATHIVCFFKTGRTTCP